MYKKEKSFLYSVNEFKKHRQNKVDAFCYVQYMPKFNHIENAKFTIIKPYEYHTVIATHGYIMPDI